MVGMTTKYLATLALLPLALGACGSSGSPDDNAPDDSDAARVKFEQCLRDHGVNVQSAPDGKGSRIEFKSDGKGGGSPKKFEETQKTCQKQAGFKPKPPSEAQQAEFKDAALKFARCMRSHGINMPDPQFEGNGGVLQRGPRGVNPNAPRFKTAQKECGRLMPGGGPAGEGPGAGGGEVAAP